MTARREFSSKPVGLLASLLLPGLPGGSLWATPAEPTFGVYGVGHTDCGFIAQTDNPELAAVTLESWVFGFITAVGMEYAFDESETVRLRQSDEELMMAWVEDYCRRNPDKDLADAAFYLAVAMLEPKPVLVDESNAPAGATSDPEEQPQP